MALTSFSVSVEPALAIAAAAALIVL